ncbi:hypothetical protein JHC09_09665 [Devosia sp. MC532]|uniref:hypothetical protein n=1 Tax=Devosia sp. MC532 TaxID=2799788 RepID=UPI0018F2E817|nr:hypothetical protein [Devosia sp. MC532]MBJ7578154.1 hypothetical protein [Devosia sp. MC532]
MSDDTIAAAPYATIVSYEEFNARRQLRAEGHALGVSQREQQAHEELDIEYASCIVEEILEYTDYEIERLASGMEEYLSGAIDVQKEMLRKLILLIDFITDSPRKRVAEYLREFLADKDIGDLDLNEMAGVIAYRL